MAHQEVGEKPVELLLEAGVEREQHILRVQAEGVLADSTTTAAAIIAASPAATAATAAAARRCAISAGAAAVDVVAIGYPWPCRRRRR